jgi:hypothetical protein
MLLGSGYNLRHSWVIKPAFKFLFSYLWAVRFSLYSWLTVLDFLTRARIWPSSYQTLEVVEYCWLVVSMFGADISVFDVLEE